MYDALSGNYKTAAWDLNYGCSRYVVTRKENGSMPSFSAGMGPIIYKNYELTVPAASGKAVAPTGSPVSGFVTFGQQVTLQAAEGAVIYYTTDGTTPDITKTQYTAGAKITLTADTTVMAAAYETGKSRSDIVTLTYTQISAEDISVSPAAATVSPGHLLSFQANVTLNSSPDAEHEGVAWLLVGNLSNDTSLSENGVLTVAENETADTLTVKAVSDFDEGVYATSAVTVNKESVTLNIQNDWDILVRALQETDSGDIVLDTDESDLYRSVLKAFAGRDVTLKLCLANGINVLVNGINVLVNGMSIADHLDNYTNLGVRLTPLAPDSALLPDVENLDAAFLLEQLHNRALKLTELVTYSPGAQYAGQTVRMLHAPDISPSSLTNSTIMQVNPLPLQSVEVTLDSNGSAQLPLTSGGTYLLLIYGDSPLPTTGDSSSARVWIQAAAAALAALLLLLVFRRKPALSRD